MEGNPRPVTPPLLGANWVEAVGGPTVSLGEAAKRLVGRRNKKARNFPLVSGSLPQAYLRRFQVQVTLGLVEKPKGESLALESCLDTRHYQVGKGH